jgi:hypothetical protein
MRSLVIWLSEITEENAKMPLWVIMNKAWQSNKITKKVNLKQKSIISSQKRKIFNACFIRFSHYSRLEYKA